jgi:CRP-like cAMP-binding protein
MATQDDVKKIREDYDQALASAEAARAKALAQAADEMPQKDIIEATGYSRETVRRIIMEGRKLLSPARPAGSEETTT